MDLIEVERIRVATTRADLALAPGETLLGGGTWLFSEPQPAVRGLVDLTTMGWDAVVPLADGGVSVAATCTLAQLRDAADLFGTATPLVPDLVDALLGSWKIHRVATVGGNICLALPAGPMTSLAVGLGASAVIWSPNGTDRHLPVADLVTGVRQTSLAPGEVLRSVEFPAPPAWAAYRRVSLAPLGRSAALLVARTGSPGTDLPGTDFAATGDGFTLTVTASTPSPRVFTFAAIPTAEALAREVDTVTDWHDDAHGAADWRRAMTLSCAEELRAEVLRAEANS